MMLCSVQDADAAAPGRAPLAEYTEPIAVIGMSGRYPDAANLQQFWKNLAAGKDSIREIPASRWNCARYYDSRRLQERKIYCKWLGALDEIECFDPLFFGISPAEAERMDPQQRIFLQEAYHALEDSGHDPRSLSGLSCGIYLGLMGSEYATVLLNATGGTCDATGNSGAIAAARLAYHLNLKGPAIALDTACSSSLVATHLACQALRCREVDLALAGGVTLYLTPQSYINMCAAGMLAADGRCKAFDNRADGFVPGEGAGVLVLKRLTDAQASGDRIHGLIVGSGINQDGRTNGITAPSATSQTQLARAVYERFRIEPRGIGYVEMHGTGTKLGDPVELEALAAAFGRELDRCTCAIGSVKTNIGHTSAAAGVAGVHKALLCLRHATLVPSLHYDVPNEHFDFGASPFYVNTQLRPWTVAPGGRRRAAVSSFGFSGTNAHLVIEEYPAQEVSTVSSAAPEPRPPELILLSARDESSLRTQAACLADHLDQEQTDLQQLAYTLQVGREALGCRCALITDSTPGLLGLLRDLASGVIGAGTLMGSVPGGQHPALPSHDEDVGLLLRTWFRKGRLRELAQLWIGGIDIRWRELYGTQRPGIASLPTYAFAKGRHWIAGLEPPSVETGSTVDPREQVNPPQRAALTLVPVWRAVAPTDVPWRAQTDLHDPVLVVGSQEQCKGLAGVCGGVRTLVVSRDDSIAALADKLRACGDIGHICWIADGGSAARTEAAGSAALCEVVPSCYRLIKAVLDLGYAVRTLRWTVVTVRAQWLHSSDIVYAQQAGVHGLIGAMAKEFPSWNVTLVDVDTPGEWPWSQILSLPPDSQGNAWLFRDARWYRQHLARIEPPVVRVTPYRAGGVYVVIGGAGAIGEAWSEHVIRSCQARVVWIGRRERDTGIDDKIRRLAALGPEPLYIQADATDSAALQRARALVLEKFGAVNALVFATLVLLDRGLLNMDEQRFRATFAAKALVCARGAEVFSHDPLDFVLYFSSLESFTKSAGQGNYAAGCTCSDAFAHEWARHAVGKTKVKIVNWGYWGQQGGARGVQGRQLKGLAEAGITSIEPAEAMRTLEGLLSGPSDQLVYLQTTRAVTSLEGIGELLDSAGPVHLRQRDPVSVAEPSATELQDHVSTVLVTRLAAALKLAPGSIDVQRPFADYGVDSISGVRIIVALNEALGLQLPATSLFDFPSVKKLVAHIVAQHRQAVLPSLGRTPPPTTERPPQPTGTQELEREPLAIIGMSGRFPQSENLAGLWNHLAAGDDLIERATRWPSVPDVETPLWGGFLGDIDRFEPLFFSISPTEAAYTDPQQRLFLEEAWSALEDAGYAGSVMQGARCGVYVGCRAGDYTQLLSPPLPPHAMWGNSVATLSARIAYHLDLRGPAVSVDTACSSSLVAVHLACQGLWMRETRMAIAGGVAVQCTSELHLSGTRAGMLSPNGRCRSFDHRADGFVPAEGVGVIVLKRLSDALADGDHIHGVIRGSGVNQDGASNGITAPSALAQEELEREVYASFGIHPESIGMVEAHGTGTILGDPIEVRALTRAFRAQTQARAYCALGSVKSNLGHTIATAGICGALKVLLSLQHRQIPPSLHFERSNPHIDLEDSPFFVNTQLREWQVPAGARRRAAVSSFGISGTNAHVVIEEAPEQVSLHASRPAYLIVFSARSSAQLREQANRLAVHCGQTPDIDCGDMSYTLCVGRRHHEHRLACVTSHTSDLVRQLKKWLEGEGSSDVYTSEPVGVLPASEPGLELPDSDQPERYLKWLHQHAQQYVRGNHSDLAGLFAGDRYRRVSLPTYPFAGARYWPSPTKDYVAAPARTILPALLPQGAANVGGHRFTLRLSGNELVFSSHSSDGAKLLHGSAYLEMARAAIAQVAGWESLPLSLRDVVWLQPLAHTGTAVEVSVDLEQVSSREIGFCIRTGPRNAVVHCKGRALRDVVSQQPLELATLRSRCPTVVTGTQCYEALEAAGVHNDSYARSIDAVYIGDGEALARLIAPDTVVTGPDAAVLDPILLSGALQAAVGFGVAEHLANEGTKTAPAPGLLFAIEAVEILQPLERRMWAWVRTHVGEGGGRHNRLDIDIADDAGHLRARLRGITLRKSAAPSRGVELTEDPVGRLTLVPLWEPDPSVVTAEETALPALTAIIPGSEQHRLILDGRYPGARVLAALCVDTATTVLTELRTAGPFKHIVWFVGPSAAVDPTDERMLAEQDTGVFAGLALVKGLLAQGYAHRDLELTVISVSSQAVHRNEALHADHAGVHGLVGTVAKEYPQWRVRLVDLERPGEASVPEILSLSADEFGNARCKRDGRWYRQVLAQCALPPATNPLFRAAGVYVIVGGAGGLGSTLSEYLIRKYSARIIWIGRRARDSDIDGKLAYLGTLGPAPEYISADATDRAALERALEQILARYGRVHGVVHSALVMAGGDLTRMDDARFRGGLAAKASVCVRLAQVFGGLPLDFLLFFGSIQSFEKTRGQANYAAGCTFEDAFAHQLARTCGYPVRVINWGYWGSVGFAAQSGSFRNWIAEAGMGSIEPIAGMEVLERLLAGPLQQLVFVETTRGDALRGVRVSSTRQIRVAPSAPCIAMDTAPTSASTESVSLPDVTASEFDAQLARLLWAQLRAMGLFDGVLPLEPRTWARRIGLPAPYDRWLEESFCVLSEHGHLVRNGSTYSVPPGSGLEVARIWQEWQGCKEKWGAHPQLRAQIALLEATLWELPQVLKGERSATSVLFPGASTALVKAVYESGGVARFFNRVLARVLTEYIERRVARDGGGRLRIIEIGAGTGATTGTLIEALRPFDDLIDEYCFTDVSNVFLTDARTQGPQAPWITYRRFDVEAPPDAQGIDTGAFDIVIAANVLHATRDMRVTLQHVKTLLKRHGLLLLNEVTAKSLFAHLTFGLLSGWWRFEDSRLRLRGFPGLDRRAWQSVLEATGFHSVAFPAVAAESLGQQSVVAVSDGVISIDATHKARPKAAQVIAPAVNPPPDITRDKHVGQRWSDERLKAHVRQAILENLSVALTLEIAAIDLARPFADYGMDSIIGVRTVDALNRCLATELTSTSVFDYSSVNLLTEHIVSRHKEAVLRALSRNLPSGSNAWAAVPETPGKAPVPPTVAAAPAETLAVAKGASIAVAGEPVARTRFPPGDPVAIIGMSARYAGADSVEELWEALRSGRELVGPVTRWDAAEPSAGGTSSIPRRMGGQMHDIDRFDSLFFNISGVEADYMDPQQRLFLEEAWKALEDAGYAGDAVAGTRCGVYAGCSGSDYQQLYARESPAQAVWGSNPAILSARIAYFLDLKGPAITVDTACSSSLVALHLACQALWNGETDLALAGGVSVQCTPSFYDAGARAGMLSASGHCYTFDDRADGFVPGEGVGVVVLKRLSEALADRDCIHGVIRGSGINQDGTTNGITAPSARSQESLERYVYETFGIHPDTIQLVEAHGTATKLGDPIELEALTRAFRQDTQRSAYCALGSIKTNIGHTIAAAGIAGVIKVLLALRAGAIPPSLNYARGNPRIDFVNSPFYVNTELREWRNPGDEGRRAAVSAFGLSGTNAHVVIDEAPRVASVNRRTPGHLVVLSAHSVDRLRRQAEQLVAHCVSHRGIDCGDISRTLLVGRMHFEHRLACVAFDTGHLLEILRNWLSGTATPEVSVATLRDHAPARLALVRVGDNLLRACSDCHDEAEYLEHLAALGELYLQGCRLHFERLFTTERRISLPGYPFARNRHWLESSGAPGLPAPEPRAASSLEVLQPGSRQPADPQALRAVAIQHLTQVVARTLKIPSERLAADEPLESYGVDSILAVQLATALRAEFPQILGTVFFEYHSIEAVAGYLLETEEPALRQLLAQGEGVADPVVAAPPPEAAVSERPTSPVSQDMQRVAVARQPASTDSDIAIIGMSGRFPGANDVAEYWRNLTAGKDCVGEIPSERWSMEDFYIPDRTTAVARARSFCKWGGFIDGIDRFDAEFFGISAGLAANIDPQERLFLEEAWKAVEDAGYTRELLRRSHGSQVGVYVGVSSQLYNFLTGPGGEQSMSGMGSYAAIANRVSYQLGLSGPSVAVDATCASSITAIHQACKDLRLGECELAIAGGINLNVHPRRYTTLSQGGVIGSRLDSRSFGTGDGFLPAEAVGVVLLKPLARAVQAGDRILAVIKGTAVGYGGRSTGYSVPNPNAQAQLIRDCLQRARIDARTISYVEAAAGGAAIGDSLEFAALNQVFAKQGADPGYCALGSVKSYLGHAEAASGMSQLIKVVLELMHGKLVPAAAPVELNPEIRLAGSPFHLQRSLRDWDRPTLERDGAVTELPRRALINSYGAGSYANLALEEFVASGESSVQRASEALGQHVFVMSARSPERLRVVVERLVEHLANNPGLPAADVAFTLQTGREGMESRVAIIASGLEELIASALAYLDVVERSASADVLPNVFAASLEDDSAKPTVAAGVFAETARGTSPIGRTAEDLARSWIHGEKILWQALYVEGLARRVELPVYPFARNSHWIGRESWRTAVVSDAPDAVQPANEDEPGSSRKSIERTLDSIWREVLKRGPVAHDESFFDLGGDSMLATRVVARIRDALEIDLPVGALFEAPTIEELSAYCQAMPAFVHKDTAAEVGEPALERGML